MGSLDLLNKRKAMPCHACVGRQAVTKDASNRYTEGGRQNVGESCQGNNYKLLVTCTPWRSVKKNRFKENVGDNRHVKQKAAE